MSFRISTSKSLKENDLRILEIQKPAESVKNVNKNDNKNDNNSDDLASDTLEELFDFTERKTMSNKSGLVTSDQYLKKSVTIVSDQSKNAPQCGFAIQNQRRGMEDFL